MHDAFYPTLSLDVKATKSRLIRQHIPTSSMERTVQRPANGVWLPVCPRGVQYYINHLNSCISWSLGSMAITTKLSFVDACAQPQVSF